MLRDKAFEIAKNLDGHQRAPLWFINFLNKKPEDTDTHA